MNDNDVYTVLISPAGISDVLAGWVNVLRHA